MTAYNAAICHIQGSELVPVESLNFTANGDSEAIQKAVAWRTETIGNFDPNQRAWLQVRRDGISIFSKEVGQVA